MSAASKWELWGIDDLTRAIYDYFAAICVCLVSFYSYARMILTMLTIVTNDVLINVYSGFH